MLNEVFNVTKLCLRTLHLEITSVPMMLDLYSKLQNHRKKHCIASFVTGPGKKTGGCPSVPDNKENHTTNVLSGVPQGTVLAPLLFLLYVNDLPDCVCNKMKLYADDVLSTHSVADGARLQEDLNLLYLWSVT